MLPISQRDLAHRSRDPRSLIRSSLVIVGASLVLALALSAIDLARIATGSEFESQGAEELLEKIGVQNPETMPEWVQFVRTGYAGDLFREQMDARWLDSAEERTGDRAPLELETTSLSDDEKALLHHLFDALHGVHREGIRPEVESLPEELPLRSEILGDLAFLEGDYALAREGYQDERERNPDSLYSRRSIVVTAWREMDRSAIRSLLEDPVYRDAFSANERLELRADARNYTGLAVDVVFREWGLYRLVATIPALFAAAIWFLILMPFWTISRERVIAALVSFLLGIASAGLTIYLVMVQERIQGFTEPDGSDPISHLLYFVAGVGLREEVAKLVCFLPVAIWAAPRRKPIEGMILAACTGLGFAFQENIAYLHQSFDSYLAWVRFLTSSVLHFSLTGIAGFYLYRMIQRKFHGWEEFLAAFIAVVIGHGFYNSLIILPSLATYSPLSPILVAIMAYRFFDPLRSNMDTLGIGQRISPLGVFVIGSALLTCSVLVSTSTYVPFRMALGNFAASLGGMIPLSFAFISRFRDL